jgi:hypothetical protein
MNKKKKVIIGVLAVALVMVVGYALFSDTLTISGTATAEGNFDMQIISAEVTGEVGSTGATTQVSSDNNTLTINIPKLEYPGAYVDVTYKVKNAGSVPAIFDSYSITGETDRIKAQFQFENYFYDVSDEQNETIRIYWDENNNTETEESATITLKLNYIQVDSEEVACTKLQEREDWFLDCQTNYTDNCWERLEYDFNHDGISDWSDGDLIDYFVYENMQCSSN